MPAPSDLAISRIGPDSDVLLRNLFEHYVHDMTEWFEIDTQADGSYSYDTSAIWSRGSTVYLAKVGDSIAGFAVTGLADGVHDMNEFFVLRRFRRRGFGARMAALIWDACPGEWEVRVLEDNAPAVLFWRAAISRQSGGVYSEEERTVNGSPWRHFRWRGV